MNGKGANLFELAGKHVDYAFLLCLVGIYEVFLTLAATDAAGAGQSSDGRGERHGDPRGDQSIFIDIMT